MVHNGFVFVAGQLPADNNGNIILGTVEEQALLCLDRIRTILKASNSSLSRIVKVNVYVADIGNWAVINAVYAKFFGEHRPARVVIPTGPLHSGVAVEIDCIAAVNE
jgi:2-iminobutanoate/2-iminopropanoate deaminase